MFAVRRFRRSTSANAAQAAPTEQTKVHVPLPHTPTEVPPYASGLRGETLAGQRRGNIRGRSQVLGRAEPTLVEQSLGPVNED